MKTLKIIAAAIVVFSTHYAKAQDIKGPIQPIPFDKIQIVPEKVTANFYAMTGSANVDPGHPEGAGGRFGVFFGPEGVFMVDGQYGPLTEKVVAAIKKLTNAQIRFLVNTHEHPDHTGGNPNYARLGAVVISREETRKALAAPMPPLVLAAIGNAASNTDPLRLPTLTFGNTGVVKIYLNGETIDLIPVVPAHTDGDCMVRFEHEDIIMIGDFYRDYGYPFIDLQHGGNYAGIVEAVDELYKIAGPNTKLIPGHGNIVTREALIPYRDMIIDIRKKVAALIAAGKSKPEVLAAKVTASYDAKVPGGTAQLPAGLGTSADRFIGAMYDEVKKQN
jgi:cyclase